jgi:cytoskeletal protein CcmA (bactofilin family)
MNAVRKRKTMDGSLAQDAAWTLIGPGSVVRGELLLPGDVVVHGRVEGTLFVDGLVHVAATGSVEGGIHARRVVVEGTCRGRLEGTQEVLLKTGCVVHAEIEAGILTVEDGARVFESGSASLGENNPKILPFKRSQPGQA